MQAQGNTLILYGKLDPERACDLENALIALRKRQEPEMIVDLTNVTYVSSLCLGAIVIAHFECANRNRTLRVRICDECRQYFEFANLNKILNVEVVE